MHGFSFHVSLTTQSGLGASMHSSGAEEVFNAKVWLGTHEIWQTQILGTISNKNTTTAMLDVDRLELKVINAFAAAKFGGGLPNSTKEQDGTAK